MSPRYIAAPPLQITRGALKKYLRRMLVSVRFIIWQIVVPFNSQPEEVDSIPEPTAEVVDEQVEQCQWIFDQAEERRVHLEQKAQSTFGLMMFLVPLLASLFVFVISKAAASGVPSRNFAIGLLGISAVLLLLGFTSAVRAVGVKAKQTLFLNSVIDDAGQFREYSKSFHARGLLYCAAMNEAMNDHLAQFVKGAHILTAAAIATLVMAAVPTSIVLSNLPTSAAQMKVVGPVEVSSPEIVVLRDEVTDLKKAINNLSNSKAAEDAALRRIDGRIAKLEAKRHARAPRGH